MLRALVLITTITLIIPRAAGAANQELTFSLETPALSNTQTLDASVDARAVETPAPQPEEKKEAKKSGGVVVGRVGVV